MQTSQTHLTALDNATEADLLNDVAELAEKEALAASEFEDLSKDLEERGKLLEGLYPIHAGLFTEAAVSLSALRQQLEEALRNERAESEAGASPEPDWDLLDELDRNDPISKPKEKPKGDVKKLFKMLANACHPDKTKDERLIKLFSDAKLARDNGDLGTLQDLVLDLQLLRAGEDVDQRVIPDLLDKLMGRRVRLSKKITMWNFKKNQLIKTPLGQVYFMTEHSDRGIQEQGKAMFKSFLLERVAHLEKEATNLRTQLLLREIEPVS